MRHKPWPILILALVHCLLPFFNAAMAARASNLGYFQYLYVFFRIESFSQILTHFLLLPIAGWAIYSMKKWSYPLYLIVMGWASYNTLWNFHSLHLVNISSFFVPILVNLILMSYFLLPSVRKVYFNKSLRWWESQERYPFITPCKLIASGKTLSGEIQNISEGGCFLKTKDAFAPVDPFRIFFSFESFSFELSAVVIHTPDLTSAIHSSGFKFVLTRASRKDIGKVILSLRKKGVVASNRVSTGSSFMKWIRRLITTGRGFFPEGD